MRAINEDTIQCAKYVANGVIVTLWDYTGRRPSVDDIKNNYNVIKCGYQLSDAEIADIIERVARYY